VPAFAHEEKSQSPLPTANIEPQLNAQLPLGLSFRDETGREIQLRDYFTGKPVLLTFVYYECPELCPLVLDGLVRSLRVRLWPTTPIRSWPSVVTRTKLRPWRRPETSIIWRTFPNPQTASNWHFLTGKAPAIAQLSASRRLSLCP
jgi:protein SCO1/2